MPDHTKYMNAKDSINYCFEWLKSQGIKKPSRQWITECLRLRTEEPELRKDDGTEWYPARHFACSELTRSSPGWKPGMNARGKRAGQLVFLVKDLGPGIWWCYKNLRSPQARTSLGDVDFERLDSYTPKRKDKSDS